MRSFENLNLTTRVRSSAWTESNQTRHQCACCTVPSFVGDVHQVALDVARYVTPRLVQRSVCRAAVVGPNVDLHTRTYNTPARLTPKCLSYNF